MTTTATYADTNANADINVAINVATKTLAMHEHEIPRYYQGRVLAYLFRNAALLKTRTNHAVPVRMEMHEHFNRRTYNAVKTVLDEKIKEKEVPAEQALYDPLNALFMSIGCGDYDYVFTDAKAEKHAFEIDYREEANPRPTSCDGMVYFRRLLFPELRQKFLLMLLQCFQLHQTF